MGGSPSPGQPHTLQYIHFRFQVRRLTCKALGRRGRPTGGEADGGRRKAAGVVPHPKHGGAPTARESSQEQLVHGQGQRHVVAIGLSSLGGSWDLRQCLGVLKGPRGCRRETQAAEAAEREETGSPLHSPGISHLKGRFQTQIRHHLSDPLQDKARTPHSHPVERGSQGPGAVLRPTRHPRPRPAGTYRW